MNSLREVAGSIQSRLRAGIISHEVLNNIYFWKPVIETLKDRKIGLFIVSRESQLNGQRVRQLFIIQPFN